MYAPGMLADLVREIRDATRVREEAIFTKVRSIIDEKNCNKVSRIILFNSHISQLNTIKPVMISC